MRKDEINTNKLWDLHKQVWDLHKFILFWKGLKCDVVRRRCRRRRRRRRLSSVPIEFPRKYIILHCSIILMCRE